MKRIIFLPLLFLLPRFIFAQSNNPISFEDQAFAKVFSSHKKPIIKGEIKNITPEELSTLRVTYQAYILTNGSIVNGKVVTEKDGKFSIQMPHNFGYQSVFLSVGSFWTEMIAHDEVTITLDWKLVKRDSTEFWGAGVEYHGPDSAINAYRNKYHTYRRLEQRAIIAGTSTLSGKTPSASKECLIKIMKLYEPLAVLEKDYQRENDKALQWNLGKELIDRPSTSYRWMFDNDRQSLIYSMLLGVSKGFVIEDSVWNLIREHKPMMLSGEGARFYESLNSYLSSLPPLTNAPNWAALLDSKVIDPTDKQKIQFIINEIAKQTNKTPYDTAGLNRTTRFAYGKYSAEVERIRLDDKLKRIDKMLPKAKADVLKLSFHEGDPVSIKMKLEQILPDVITPWCKDFLTQEYDQANRASLVIATSMGKYKELDMSSAIGTPIAQTNFGAQMYRVDSLTSKELIDKIRQRNPDKAILIDIWGTWCHPCLDEMPDNRERATVLREDPIAFVFLCTSLGSPYERWKNNVAWLEVPGLHIYTDQKIIKSLFVEYKLTGYPSHLLISKSGKVTTIELHKFREMSLKDIRSMIEKQE